MNFLRKEKLWGNDDPLFPATRMGNDTDRQFEVVGLARKHWSNATAIRKIFKDAFANAGLPYANPHSFRNTLAQLAYELRLGPEEFKVWSQNLGHESILTTFSSYGKYQLIDRPKSCANWPPNASQPQKSARSRSGSKN